MPRITLQLQRALGKVMSNRIFPWIKSHPGYLLDLSAYGEVEIHTPEIVPQTMIRLKKPSATHVCPQTLDRNFSCPVIFFSTLRHRMFSPLNGWWKTWIQR